MSGGYAPTKEQAAVISHDGSAFVSACPGAGKTRTMVERARLLLSDGRDRRGVAFLSFTNAAVDELEARLRRFGILPMPLFPSFIGTFDRFLWQFFVAPFGMEGCDVSPRLIPDKGDWVVRPHETMQGLPLKAFDRGTGRLNRTIAADEGFNMDRDATRHEALALRMLASARSKGHVDFEDVRTCVKGRRCRAGVVADLPGNHEEAQGPPVRITDGVTLGVHAAFGTTDQPSKAPFLTRRLDAVRCAFR